MRIQETDAILKDSKINRKHANQHESTNVFSKTWRMITSLFKK